MCGSMVCLCSWWRLCERRVVGRERGGLDAEAEERQRWIDKENRRIMDSVNGNDINL